MSSPSRVQTSYQRPRSPARRKAHSLLGTQCFQHRSPTWMGTGRPRSETWTALRPHLWSVLLELSALLDKPLSRLLALILPVRQYCCGGIEFPLLRHKKGGQDCHCAAYQRTSHLHLTRTWERPPWLRGFSAPGWRGLGAAVGESGYWGSYPPPCARVPEHQTGSARRAPFPRAQMTASMTERAKTFLFAKPRVRPMPRCHPPGSGSFLFITSIPSRPISVPWFFCFALGFSVEQSICLQRCGSGIFCGDTGLLSLIAFIVGLIYVRHHVQDYPN